MSFRNLEIWKKAILLADNIYSITKNFPKSEIYGLSSQMQRAGVSVSSNIAEGYRRNSDKEFALFLRYARGSAGELESQIEIAKLQNYINQEEYNSLTAACDEISKMIFSFEKKLK
jgi:four helix bundle protein